MTIRNTLNTGVSRAMFNTPTYGHMMARGPQVSYNADDGTAGGGGEDANAIAIAVKAAADKAAAEAEASRKAALETEATRKAALEGDTGTKPSDEEAKLLKELMKFKRAAEASDKAATEAAAKLKDYEGIDPSKVRAMIAAQEKADLEASEKRGEYDRIVKQIRDDHEKAMSTEAQKAKDLQDQLAVTQRRVDDLVVGSSFNGSRFLNDNTVLSGDKARRLYGDHFDVEDGQFVAYDKPRGSSDRTPLVDAKTGEKLGFEAAIEKIVKADPDFERIAKSKLRPGANSAQGQGDNSASSQQKKPLSGVELISANLKALMAAK